MWRDEGRGEGLKGGEDELRRVGCLWKECLHYGKDLILAGYCGQRYVELNSGFGDNQ
jgi:hypothetical protein